MTKTFSYNRKEKLKSKKQLDELFTTGKSFSIFPLKVLYQFVDEQEIAVKTGVGVSSRFFKKAVDRNRIKRLLREAYRTEKQPLHIFLNNNKIKINVFLLFIDKALPTYRLVNTKMKFCMERLIQELNEAVTKNT